MPDEQQGSADPRALDRKRHHGHDRSDGRGTGSALQHRPFAGQLPAAAFFPGPAVKGHDSAVVTAFGYWNHPCAPDCRTWVPNHRRRCARHEVRS
jgi:hypothetical protein